MKLTELRCPNCGANLSFTNVRNGKVQCEYCESNYEYEEEKPATQYKPIDNIFRETEKTENIFEVRHRNVEELDARKIAVFAAAIWFCIIFSMVVASIKDSEPDYSSDRIWEDFLTQTPAEYEEEYANYKEWLYNIYEIAELEIENAREELDPSDYSTETIKILNSYMDEMEEVVDYAIDNFATVETEEWRIDSLITIKKELQEELIKFASIN